MKYVFIHVAMALLFILLAGCTELKNLRIENADQKLKIAQLSQDGDECRDALSESKVRLLQARKDLVDRDSMLSEQKAAFERMQEEMRDELDSQQEAFDDLKGKLTLTIVESILFDPGKTEVKREGAEVLRKVAESLKTMEDREILVAGYTDNSRIRGRLARVYPSNWELSTARAITVMRFLEKQGIDPRIMSAVGYGEYRPVSDNRTPEGRARNRRLEIILMPRQR
jgi:chemotaxis protein MotB